MATRHELAVLEAQLEGALLAEGADLGGAVAEHQAAARERRAREAAQTGTDWLHAPALNEAAPAPPVEEERRLRRSKALA